jgi:hypothetical protein
MSSVNPYADPLPGRSIQRFHFGDFCLMVFADPEGRARARIIDFHPANVYA